MTEEEKAKRIHYHEYESCEGIEEHAERIVDLESICEDMLKDYMQCAYDKCLLVGDIDTVDGEPILESLEGTVEGARIARYIERLHEKDVMV